MRNYLGMTAVLVALVVVPALRAQDTTQELRGKVVDTTQELLDKVIKDHGGADNINKYPAWVVKTKGKVFIMGKPLDFNSVASEQPPGRSRQEITFEVMGQKISTVQVLDKDKGWLSVNSKTIEMPKEELAEAREALHSQVVCLLAPLKGKEYKLTALGECKVGERPALGLRVTRKHYRDINLFFDKKTHLLLKMETRAKDPRGGKDVSVETYFEDYKPIKGLPTPHRLVKKHDGKDFIISEATDIQLLEKLSDDLFAKP